MEALVYFFIVRLIRNRLNMTIKQNNTFIYRLFWSKNKLEWINKKKIWVYKNVARQKRRNLSYIVPKMEMN